MMPAEICVFARIRKTLLPPFNSLRRSSSVIGFANRVAHPFPIESELLVDHPLLANFHEIKEQRFEAFRCPIFDPVTLGG